MIKVGLTGNIGSGKSTVARIFEVLGIPVFHADVEAKLLLEKEDVKKEILNVFGNDIFSGKEIDRLKLATIVFNNKKSLEILNSIIHPRVRQKFYDWIEINSGYPYVIQEAAILFESGFYKMFEKTIVVSCPEEIAIKRVMERDGVAEQEVKNRIRNQWPEKKKTDLADFIVNNNGANMVIPEVLIIHETLIK